MFKSSDEKILKEVINQTRTKASAARVLGVSPRTIGRWIQTIEESNPMQDFNDQQRDSLSETGPVVAEEDTSKSVFHVSADSNSVSIIKVDSLTGECEMESITAGHLQFDEVSDMIWSSRGDQDILQEAFNKLSFKEVVKQVFKDGQVTVDMERQTVTVNVSGYPVELCGSLVSHTIDAVERGDREQGSLLRFAEKLAQNPSPRVFEEAFDFIKAMDIDITDEGDLICFKKVREDYTDCFTGTFDNSPSNPEPVWVPRNQVDDDSSRTCSKGLHVCSRAYLGHFGGVKVVSCKVDPKNIVSVPEDYYSVTLGGEVKAKMRVCEYKVLEDVTGRVYP